MSLAEFFFGFCYTVGTMLIAYVFVRSLIDYIGVE